MFYLHFFLFCHFPQRISCVTTSDRRGQGLINTLARRNVLIEPSSEQILCWASVTSDVTNCKKKEAALWQKNSGFGLTFGHTSLMHWVTHLCIYLLQLWHSCIRVAMAHLTTLTELLLLHLSILSPVCAQLCMKWQIAKQVYVAPELLKMT